MLLPRLAEMRQKNNLSQRQVAQVLNIPQQQYSRYEQGINDIPVRYVIALCRHFDLSADWLLGLTE